MIGTLLNGFGILLGGVLGLTLRRQMPASLQNRLKIGLGAFTVWVGLSLTWQAINGRLGDILKQFAIVVLSLSLGNLTGKTLRLQRFLNRLGQRAKGAMVHAKSGAPSTVSEGFVTCSLLYCVGPMAILGALQDGLKGDHRTLALKALLDGLATMAFINTFGWGVILSFIPVVAYEGTITLGAQFLQPYLTQPLMDSMSATGGMLIFCIALIILELKKIALADYLPSLIIAPALTWWWR